LFEVDKIKKKCLGNPQKIYNVRCRWVGGCEGRWVGGLKGRRVDIYFFTLTTEFCEMPGSIVPLLFGCNVSSAGATIESVNKLK
jgi:hypothetical protein